MKDRLLFSVLLFVTCAVAQEPPPITTAEREQALSTIKSWRSFEGTWEGELKYVAAPKEDWLRQRVPFKLDFKNGQPKAFIRSGIRDWRELSTTYRSNQPDELTLVIHAYGASGVWTENNVIVLTRRSEDTGEVFIQRVVNNWAGKTLADEDRVYGDTRAGRVRRQ